MSVSEISFRSWLPWKSKYWEKINSDMPVNIPGMMCCLFINLIDITEKLVHSPGLDPFSFMGQNLKRQEAYYRNKFVKEFDKNYQNSINSEDPTTFNLHNIMTNFQKFRKHNYNFFNYQNQIYDRYSFMFLTEELSESVHEKLSERFSIIDTPKIEQVTNTLKIQVEIAEQMLAIELARFLECDHFENPRSISVGISKTVQSEYEHVVHTKSDDVNYNPIKKYLTNRHLKNVDHSKIAKSKKKEKDFDSSFPQTHIFNANEFYNLSDDSLNTLSIYHATFGEFYEFLLATSIIIDRITDFICDYSYDLPDQETFSDVNTSEKTVLYHVTLNIEKKLYSRISQKQVYESCAFYIKTFLLPMTFYSLWIIKSLSKNFDRVSNHQLGPTDTSLRLLTEGAFLGNPSLFSMGNENESQETLGTLWRLCLKIGKIFNVFGIQDLEPNCDEFAEFIKSTKLSDFDDSIAEDTWYASLGIQKVKKIFKPVGNEESHNTNATHIFKYDQPIIQYSITKIWKLLVLFASKGTTLLDSKETRKLLTLLWHVLDNVINCSNLAHYYTKNKHILDQDPLYLPDTLDNDMSSFPKFFSVDAVKKSEIDPTTGLYSEIEYTTVVLSQNFLKSCESIMMYMVELITVSDYLYSTFACKPPKIPNEDFCSRWVEFCKKLCNDDNYGQFLQTKFTELYWHRSQFYGECDNYNTAQKIAQANPITSIMLNNRYRNYDVCDKVTKFPPKDIFSFCIEKILYCKNDESDIRSIFRFSWDISRCAFLREPPSIYMSDVKTKVTKLYQSSTSSNTNGADKIMSADDEEYEEMFSDDSNKKFFVDQFIDTRQSYEKEKQEMKALLETLEAEKRKKAESSWPAHSLKDFMNQNRSSMLGKDAGLGSDGNMHSSLLDRALDAKSNYKQAMDSLMGISKGSFDRKILNPDGTVTNCNNLDNMYFTRKSQFLPVGLLEFNLMQETILYTLSFKNAKSMHEISNKFGVLKTDEDIETNINRAIYFDENTGLFYPTFDSRSGINDENYPIYDNIFSRPDMILRSLSKTNQVDLLNPTENHHNYTNVYSSKKEKDATDYWGEKNVYKSMVDETEYDDCDISDEEDMTRNANRNISVTEELSKKWGIALEDEEFGIDGPKFEQIHRDKENYKKKMSRQDKSRFKDLRDLKEKQIIYKEWPDIMNYDLLQQRTQLEIQNSETPLSIIECAFDMKRHPLFRRSKKDKPCFFRYFNRYMLCDGKNLYSSHFCQSIPLISKDTRRKQEHQVEFSHYNSDSDDEYHYFSRDEIEENSDEAKCYSGHTYHFTTPYDFASMLGTLVTRFENDFETLVEKFYEHYRDSKAKIKTFDENVKNQAMSSDKKQQQLNVDELKENFTSMTQSLIDDMVKGYQTFPKIILDATLDYERVFEPISDKPMYKKITKNL